MDVYPLKLNAKRGLATRTPRHDGATRAPPYRTLSTTHALQRRRVAFLNASVAANRSLVAYL